MLPPATARARRPRLSTLLLALFVTAGPAAAEPRPPNEAAARFDAMAKAAYAHQKWEDAIAGFEAAYRADPLPRFLYNLGRCYEKVGDLARAVKHLERYLVEAPEAADREKVEALVEILGIKLRKSFSRLEVTSEPDGALVQVRGAKKPVEGRSPLREWVPFGTYEVSVAKDGYGPATRSVVVQPDETARVAVELRPADAPAEPAEPPPPAPEPPPPPAHVASPEPEPAAPPPAPAEPSAGGSLVPWLVLGGGVALAGGGLVVGNLARDDQAARDDLAEASRRGEQVPFSEVRALDDAAHSKALVANLLCAAGAAAGIGAAVLLLSGSEAAEEPAAALLPVPGGAVLVWEISGRMP